MFIPLKQLLPLLLTLASCASSSLLLVQGLTILPSSRTETGSIATTTAAMMAKGRKGGLATTVLSSSSTTTSESKEDGSSTTDVYPKRSLRQRLSNFFKGDRTREELKIGIAGFYDRSSKLWEDVWGEHMHHGYYVPADRTDHQQAQVDLIDEVLQWSSANDKAVTSVVDVGCGIGGSSRHLARKYPGCTVQGITLSPYQANRAKEITKQQGLSSDVSFQVADALQMPFADNSFDLVWSLESGEHMPDKQQFISELFRVCQPGGRIIVVTWTHRDLPSPSETLTRSELRLLNRINRAYYLPKWCSGQDYIKWFQSIGSATDVKREDWSYIIAPFWKAVIKSSLNVKSLVGLLRSGPSTIRGAYAMFLMLRGYQKGLIKFDLLTCTKPFPTNESSPSSTTASVDDKQ